MDQTVNALKIVSVQYELVLAIKPELGIQELWDVFLRRCLNRLGLVSIHVHLLHDENNTPCFMSDDNDHKSAICHFKSFPCIDEVELSFFDEIFSEKKNQLSVNRDTKHVFNHQQGDNYYYMHCLSGLGFMTLTTRGYMLDSTILAAMTTVLKRLQSSTILAIKSDLLKKEIITGIESQNKIRNLAYYDSLTGLASRRNLMQRLDEAIKTSKHRNERISLLFLDLDGFKDINDSLGHDAGDLLLTEIARLLKTALRSTDFIARLGGDEFCILIDDMSDESCPAHIADACLVAISREVDLGIRTVVPKVSIGIAHYPDDAGSMVELLKAADSAMYSAKKSGKHRYAFYNEKMSQKIEARLTLEQELYQAIEKGQFEVFYQPRISVQSGRLIAVESLVRWRHPSRGLVPSEEFIPILEHLGLAGHLGDWVVHTVCSQLMKWGQENLCDIRTCINISSLHVADGTLFHTFEKLLTDMDLSAELIELEINERKIQTCEEAIVHLNLLKELGIKISIDEFGTGFSSFSSLKNLPLDCLKIDHTFVKDLLEKAENSAVVGTIISLAHAMELKVVAEGIETLDQARTLTSLGCDWLQGTYFSRPVMATDIPSMVNYDFRLDKVSKVFANQEVR